MFTTEEIRNRGLVWDGYSLPYNPHLLDYSRAMRRKMTKAEKKIWYDFLRGHKRKFYRQRPIDHFIADFYCSDAQLIIEIDGSWHYSSEGIARDSIRTNILKLYGLRVIRFTNKQVFSDFSGVCAIIDQETAYS